ncbi:MAG: DUF302 domain-containing protein [Aquificae bacterium]|nr:DUF302 domain-containing protein [Aquificota bacterium]
MTKILLGSLTAAYLLLFNISFGYEDSELYWIKVDMSLEEADMVIQSEAEGKNLKIIKILNITKGVQEQGYKDFWEDMRIYLTCSLSMGYKIMKNNPHLAGYFPCRIFTYKDKDGKLVVGMAKISPLIKKLKIKDKTAITTIKYVEKTMREIINALKE